MLKRLYQCLCLSFLSFFLMACATAPLAQHSELAQGKRNFEAGYYKRAMHELLPLACDGSPEAQYAVGYMYYYGYGVAQDTDTGYFWINRSAAQHYPPAIKAIALIDNHTESVSAEKIMPVAAQK